MVAADMTIDAPMRANACPRPRISRFSNVWRKTKELSRSRAWREACRNHRHCSTYVVETYSILLEKGEVLIGVDVIG